MVYSWCHASLAASPHKKFSRIGMLLYTFLMMDCIYCTWNLYVVLGTCQWTWSSPILFSFPLAWACYSWTNSSSAWDIYVSDSGLPESPDSMSHWIPWCLLLRSHAQDCTINYLIIIRQALFQFLHLNRNKNRNCNRFIEEQNMDHLTETSLPFN